MAKEPKDIGDSIMVALDKGGKEEIRAYAELLDEEGNVVGIEGTLHLTQQEQVQLKAIQKSQRDKVKGKLPKDRAKIG